MILNRRELMGFGALALTSFRMGLAYSEPLEVNDVHSQLNLTRVARLIRPATVDELRTAILAARQEGRAVCISGSRHSMGGQQFGEGMVLLDLRGLNRIVAFDPGSRTIEAEAGIEWPELLNELAHRQAGTPEQLGIFQKQTGADRLTLGGALASNIHGRGLNLKPFVNDVESFRLINASGELLYCDRNTNAEFFRLAIGGYGLFGVVTSIRLRLRPRVKVRRVVRLADLHEIPDAFAGRIRDGYLYGDYQFATDSKLDSFLRRGVFPAISPWMQVPRFPSTRLDSTPKTGRV